ncbi:ATP-grasp domain-containing protein [Nesterenkonia sp. MY13]|uniref:ATP-grasp domain-containing protein n=1 Tax=Nesterenkonia sedimenti TaxID=1463632 RepID=A0A7X8TKB3_9MICC|nr:ATP-grasp domain-containing protein [Nesterenkonia sedimenti]NLS10124.1 ATP-grasp domain-containing protein [Nesterenkonia sedimenti]
MTIEKLRINNQDSGSVNDGFVLVRWRTAKGCSVDLAETRKHLRELGINAGPTATLIANRAMSRGIAVSSDERRRLTLYLGKRRIWFDGSRSNINKVLARRCTLYKDVTARLLRNYGVNAPDNMVFGAEHVGPAWQWALCKLPVVVKPPNGGKGDLVHVGIDGFAEFESAFNTVAESVTEVLVERFIPGEEHRVLLIYGKVAAAQRRIAAHILGNGRSTINKLIHNKNKQRLSSKNKIYIESQITIDDAVLSKLGSQGLSLDSVPARGQKVWLRSNSNVSSGGEAHDATDDMTPGEIAMAENVARAIPGLRVAGLDMLLPRDGNGSEPHVLEVNSSPLITGHHYPWAGPSRDVAAMLVEAMFPAATSDSSETRR